MKDIAEKVSYLQGMYEGLGWDATSPSGRIVEGILDVLEDISGSIRSIHNDFDSFKEYVDSIDDDLCELEESFIRHRRGITEMDCPSCGQELFFESDLLKEDDSVEINCPNCGEVVYINDGAFDFEPDTYTDELNN